jgi:type VI secretion system protein ImpI/type VI secretion system protein
MTLTLSMLRCPETVAPQTRTISGGEFSIGRGAENDWVLPDPERGLSKRHCLLAFRAGCWQIADISTNGTFLNRENEPIGRGAARDLRDGDRLSFGPYEIEVRVDEGRDQLPPGRGFAASDSPARPAAPAPELFALDPFASPAERARAGAAPADPLLGRTPVEDPFGVSLNPEPVSLPADFDPLAPEPELRGPTQPDHNPHIEDAFVPPPPHSVLPDDWDRDMSVVAPAAPVAAAPVPEIAEPPRATRPPPVEPPEPAPLGPPTIQPAVAAQPAAAPRPAVGDDLLTAFLRGAGMSEQRPRDPAAAMEALGRAFRAVVAGLRQTLVARAAIKGEFRIEQTMIRSRGNNPLKFSADDDDALTALLGLGRHSEMGPAEAVADALRDVRLHELATVAAMQTAIRALLAEFAPGKLRESAGHGGLALLAAQRKAAAWEAFEALHARVTQALTDDFDSVFGKAFARAYESALAELTHREDPV